MVSKNHLVNNVAHFWNSVLALPSARKNTSEPDCALGKKPCMLAEHTRRNLRKAGSFSYRILPPRYEPLMLRALEEYAFIDNSDELHQENRAESVEIE